VDARPVAGDRVVVVAEPLEWRIEADDLPLLHPNGRYTAPGA
jgi:hypothetical protein